MAYNLPYHSGVTGGSYFSLFITVNVVTTFIAIFDGIIILIAQIGLMSVVFISVVGTVQCGKLFRLSQCKELYISAFFLSKWKSI